MLLKCSKIKQYPIRQMTIYVYMFKAKKYKGYHETKFVGGKGICDPISILPHRWKSIKYCFISQISLTLLAYEIHHIISCLPIPMLCIFCPIFLLVWPSWIICVFCWKKNIMFMYKPEWKAINYDITTIMIELTVLLLITV